MIIPTYLGTLRTTEQIYDNIAVGIYSWLFPVLAYIGYNAGRARSCARARIGSSLEVGSDKFNSFRSALF